MKNWGTKRNVFIASGVIAGAVIIWDYVGNVRWCTWGGVEHYNCLDTLSNIETLFFFIFPIFLLSLITFWMKEEVFRAWWNFARWMLPVIVLATVLIQFMPSNRGFFNMDGLIYLLVLAPLYAILILGSLWKIVRTHQKLKKA